MAGRHEAYFRERLRRSFPDVWELLGEARARRPAAARSAVSGTTPRGRLATGRVLVGDAATFIHPFTGEGVFFALRGAQLAADAIDAALRASDTSHVRAAPL